MSTAEPGKAIVTGIVANREGGLVATASTSPSRLAADRTLRSTDNGASWSALPLPDDVLTYVNHVFFHPFLPNLLFVDVSTGAGEERIHLWATDTPLAEITSSSWVRADSGLPSSLQGIPTITGNYLELEDTWIVVDGEAYYSTSGGR